MNKFVKYTLLTFVVLILLLGAFSGGFVTGHFSSAIFARNGLPSIPGLGALPTPYPPAATPEAAVQSTPADLQTLFTPFWEAWDLVHDRYVDQPVDDTKLMQGAIRGMLESLGDQHTSYMDPKNFKDANASLSGEYEGIGAYVDTSGDFLKVISPIAGSPAEKAGIQTGDVIIAIDGKDMTGIAPEVARQSVLGPAGTTVIITIQRKDVEKPIDISVTRAKITIASVESKMLENDIAYVKLNTFGETTTKELRSALKELMAKNPKGLIFDLRNNGGGYLVTGIEVTSQFIEKGVVVSEKYGDGKVEKFDATGGGLATEIPMVVLVNEGSASASEIVAGALQDYGRAKLVGVTTYGKGSVQIWTPLTNEQGAVRVTVAKWLTPKDRTIDKIGLIPEVVVERTEEDYKAQRDPQLDKAIEVLLGLLK